MKSYITPAVLTALLIVSVLARCAPSAADSTRAVVIPAPMAGYTCFAIMNGNNVAVGGNCLPN